MGVYKDYRKKIHKELLTTVPKYLNLMCPVGELSSNCRIDIHNVDVLIN